MSEEKNLSYKKYLMQIWPNMLAHLTTPFLRIVEVAIVGRALSSVYMASLGIGVTLLTTIDWLLSFLRVSVIADSGKAVQDGDKKLQAQALTRHISIVVVIGILLLMGKDFLWDLAMMLYQPELEVQLQGKIYFDIAIWTIPITLINYIIMGWLFGRGKVKSTVVLEIGTNIMNIIFCFIFLKHIKLVGIAKLAICTKLIILFIGITLILREDKEVIRYMINLLIWYPRGIVTKIKTYMDTFLRTVCIVIVTHLVMIASSHFGTAVLAGNFVMMQLKDMMAYVFEGISTTIRGIAARSKLEKKDENLKEVHRMTLKTIMYVSIGLVMLYMILRIQIVDNLVHVDEIKSSLLTYDGWLLFYPIVAGWGLSAYGLYVGFTQVKLIGNSAFIGLVVFLVTYIFAMPTLGNHGVWFAFVMFYLVRSILVLGYEGYLYE